MPMVLILFSVVLLGIAAGGAIVLLDVSLAVTPGRGRRELTISLILLAVVLAVYFGGGLVLSLLGLSWRRWVCARWFWRMLLRWFAMRRMSRFRRSRRMPPRFCL